jgi:two-component system cell cycle response regulator DivK
MANRILIVEDDHLNRMFLCAVLQGSGFSTEEVGDGAKVLPLVKEFAPDLITMDIHLPNVSGLELIKMLKADEDLKRIPILAVTAYVGRGDNATILQAGADEMMTKPLSIKPLLRTIEKLLTPDAPQP